MFVMHQNIFKKEYDNTWVSKDYNGDFNCYLNPKIEDLGNNKLEEKWESNPSFPLIKTLARRYEKIGVTYYNKNMDYI